MHVGQLMQQNVYNVQTALRQNPSMTNTLHQVKGPRSDSVSISPQGRAAQLIENLQKQREAVVEQKNQLVATTLENGGSLEDIEAPLDAFQEKLDSLDAMMAETLNAQMTAQAQQLAGNTEEKPAKEPETEEEAEAQNLQALTGMAAGMEQAKAVQSTAATAAGKARSLKGNIAQDRALIYDRENRRDENFQKAELSPAEKQMIRKYKAHANDKESQMKAFTKKAAQLSGLSQDKLAEVNETANKGPAVAKEKEPRTLPPEEAARRGRPKQRSLPGANGENIGNTK